MEEDKLILSLLARVRTCAGEKKNDGCVADMDHVCSLIWTKVGEATRDNLRIQTDLIIIHNRIERLDPHGVNIPI